MGRGVLELKVRQHTWPTPGSPQNKPLVDFLWPLPCWALRRRASRAPKACLVIDSGRADSFVSAICTAPASRGPLFAVRGFSAPGAAEIRAQTP